MMSHSSPGLVLIVDDTPANLEVISDALEDAGFEVALATNGDRALRQLELQLPDLILLDVMMPEMDGFTVCSKLKANPATQDIPVIFMTALSDTESKTQGFALGAVDYITKPFQEVEVIARVKTHLKLHNLTKSLEAQVEQRTQELQASQLQLVQSEKMSALGSLMSGVAHEINNPLNFIAGNLEPACLYFNDLCELIDLYQSHYPTPAPDIVEKIDTIDLDYLKTDLTSLINSMKVGMTRIKEISTSLRIFSRADSDRAVAFNIHEGIDSTLHILKHRLKGDDFRPEIEVIRDYDTLPEIACFPGQLNQVFMNLFANAIDAIDEKSKMVSLDELSSNPNRIVVRTQFSDDPTSVLIKIQDNAIGMPADVQAKIFDYLYTTKAVGKGTGLGLAISKQIIEELHGGILECHSVLKAGTEFIIKLPL